MVTLSHRLPVQDHLARLHRKTSVYMNVLNPLICSPPTPCNPIFSPSHPASTYTMVNATQFLTTLLQTHEWAQYAYQSIACMRSPTIGANCAYAFPGQGIADINEPPYLSAYNYDGGFDYAYTFVQFNGWQRQNFTALSATWLNATKIAMLTSCIANSTCRGVYGGFASADTVLTQYINAAITNLSLALPTSGVSTWNPSTNYANALSAWTTISTLDTEVFGVHDGLSFAAKNTSNVTVAQLEGAYDLRIYMSGGAEMVETVLSYIAFRFYDHYANGYQGALVGYTPPTVTSTSSSVKTSSTKSSSSTKSTTTSSKSSSSTSKSSSSSKTTSKAGSATNLARAAAGIHSFASNISPNRKFDDLQRMAVLRGPARKEIASLKMSNYRDLMQRYSPEFDMTPALLTRDCSSLTGITYVQGALEAVSVLCSLATIQNAYLELTQITNIIGMNTVAQALKVLGVTELDTVASVMAAVSTVCTAGQVACFPSSSIWNFDTAAAALSAVGIAVSIGTGGLTAGLAVNVACLVEGIALQAYNNAAQCCAQNCNSPACTAGGIACSVVGLQC